MFQTVVRDNVDTGTFTSLHTHTHKRKHTNINTLLCICTARRLQGEKLCELLFANRFFKACLCDFRIHPSIEIHVQRVCKQETIEIETTNRQQYQKHIGWFVLHCGTQRDYWQLFSTFSHMSMCVGGLATRVCESNKSFWFRATATAAAASAHTHTQQWSRGR